MREIEDLQEEKNDLAAGWIAADKTIAAQQARIDELDRELSKKAAANKALVKTLSRQQSKGGEFLQALKAYYSATVERNSTPYPEPDDRMRMAKAIDDTQAALFSLLDSSGSGWHE